MTPDKPNTTLYEQAKAGLQSLFVQTAQVSLGLIIMLVATGGNPPGWLVATSFFSGVGFVTWSENKRQSKFKDNKGSYGNNKSEYQYSVVSGFIAASDHSMMRIPPTSYTSTHRSKRKRYDRDQYLRLQKGVNVWNHWRQENFNIIPTLADSNLSGADLRNADLRNADLRVTDFSGADLSGADLSGANLYASNLSGANLYASNLSGAYLGHANLRYATLATANLSGVNLSNASVVYKAMFSNNLGIDDELKQNLIRRGAIFADSPEDPAEVKSPVSS